MFAKQYNEKSEQAILMLIYDEDLCGLTDACNTEVGNPLRKKSFVYKRVESFLAKTCTDDNLLFSWYLNSFTYSDGSYNTKPVM